MENIEDISLEQKINRAGKFIGRHIATIFAVLISLFFIFSGTIKVLPTELGLKEQIIMAFITIVLGYSITKLVGEQGFTSARNDEEFKRIKKDYETSVKGAIKYRGAIDEFAKDKAKENLKEMRINICESAGLYYYDIFDEKGALIKDFDIRQYKKDNHYLKKVMAFRKCVSLRLIDTSVFSKSGSSTFGIKKRKTIQGYRLKKGISSAITKVLLGISSVGIMFVWIGWSWGAIIYAFGQVIMWVGTGVVERLGNFNFMLNDIMPQYEDDTGTIEEFMSMEQQYKDIYIERARKRQQPKLLQIEQKFDTKEINS